VCVAGKPEADILCGSLVGAREGHRDRDQLKLMRIVAFYCGVDSLAVKRSRSWNRIVTRASYIMRANASSRYHAQAPHERASSGHLLHLLE
jgi:hypothetical protein